MLVILTTHPIQYQVPIWQELARRGQIEFEVWYLSDHGVRPSRDEGFGQVFQWDLDMLAGYPHRFLETNPDPADINSFQGARIGDLTPLLKEKGVTALWINGWQVQAYWQAASQAHRARIPVWLRGESNDLKPDKPIKGQIRKIALNRLFRRIQYFLYIGSANRRLYKNFGVQDQQLVPAFYCVDNKRFAQTSHVWREQRDELRQQWGIPRDATCFLFCGKFIAKKRPLDILEAALQLLQQHPESVNKDSLHILLVGDGALRQELEAKAQELEKASGRSLVSFVGFLNQQEIPKAYVAADCLILPSDFGETWGLVVNESMACGTPAIVSDQCGSAEDLALPLGEDFVFPCGDVQSLSEKMRRRIKAGPWEDRQQLKELIDSFDTLKVVDQVELLVKTHIKK